MSFLIGCCCASTHLLLNQREQETSSTYHADPQKWLSRISRHRFSALPCSFPRTAYTAHDQQQMRNSSSAREKCADESDGEKYMSSLGKYKNNSMSHAQHFLCAEILKRSGSEPGLVWFTCGLIGHRREPQLRIDQMQRKWTDGCETVRYRCSRWRSPLHSFT